MAVNHQWAHSNHGRWRQLRPTGHGRDYKSKTWVEHSWDISCVHSLERTNQRRRAKQCPGCHTNEGGGYLRDGSGKMTSIPTNPQSGSRRGRGVMQRGDTRGRLPPEEMARGVLWPMAAKTKGFQMPEEERGKNLEWHKGTPKKS